MSKTLKIVLIAAGVLIAIGLLLGGAYNNMVTAKENVTNKYSDISVQLKRRTDLIPNLVNTVKGYTAHETEIINSVTEARAKLAGAKTIENAAKADAELTSALNKLMVIVENYPELKSNQNFIQLQDELAGTENRIAVARKDYNEMVKTYNTSIKTLPKNLLAGMFGFDQVDYFEADEGDYETPNVDFE